MFLLAGETAEEAGEVFEILVVFGAVFMGHSLGELGETGWWPSFFGPAWDSGGLLPDKSGLGAVLKSLFVYDANPSVAQIAGYWSYLVIMMRLFLRPIRAVSPAQRTSKSIA